MNGGLKFPRWRTQKTWMNQLDRAIKNWWLNMISWNNIYYWQDYFNGEWGFNHHMFITVFNGHWIIISSNNVINRTKQWTKPSIWGWLEYHPDRWWLGDGDLFGFINMWGWDLRGPKGSPSHQGFQYSFYHVVINDLSMTWMRWSRKPPWTGTSNPWRTSNPA